MTNTTRKPETIQKHWKHVVKAEKMDRISYAKEYLEARNIEFLEYNRSMHLQFEVEDYFFDLWPTTNRMQTTRKVDKEYSSVQGVDNIVKELNKFF